MNDENGWMIFTSLVREVSYLFECVLRNHECGGQLVK